MRSSSRGTYTHSSTVVLKQGDMGPAQEWHECRTHTEKEPILYGSMKSGKDNCANTVGKNSNFRYTW